jgi:hypothetical protein
MMQSPSVADQLVERILELSADLQIKRRATANRTPAYYELSASIAAYGEALGVLTRLRRQREERDVSLDLLGSFACPPEPHAVL